MLDWNVEECHLITILGGETGRNHLIFELNSLKHHLNTIFKKAFFWYSIFFWGTLTSCIHNQKSAVVSRRQVKICRSRPQPWLWYNAKNMRQERIPYVWYEHAVSGHCSQSLFFIRVKVGLLEREQLECKFFLPRHRPPHLHAPHVSRASRKTW